MLKRLMLPAALLILTLGFWASSDFQEIAAGVAIFLFGMLMLEDGFKLFSGGFLEQALEKATGSVAKSIGFGVVSTTIMQSSSLVSVITISFLSAGLISLLAGVGIIFGANIGTTTGAWLVAGFGLKVNISAYALPMLAVSILLVFQQGKYWRGVGYVLAGARVPVPRNPSHERGLRSLQGSVRPVAFRPDRTGRAHGVFSLA